METIKLLNAIVFSIIFLLSVVQCGNIQSVILNTQLNTNVVLSANSNKKLFTMYVLNITIAFISLLSAIILWIAAFTDMSQIPEGILSKFKGISSTMIIFGFLFGLFIIGVVCNNIAQLHLEQGVKDITSLKGFNIFVLILAVAYLCMFSYSVFKKHKNKIPINTSASTIFSQEPTP